MSAGQVSHRKILIGLGAGALLGIAANALVAGSPEARRWLDLLSDSLMHPVGQVFLRLLFVVVLPLVFASIAGGVASLGDLRRLGGMGARTLAFFMLTSGASALLGVGVLHLFRPGAGFDRQTVMELQSRYAGDTAALRARMGSPGPSDLISRVDRLGKQVGELETRLQQEPGPRAEPGTPAKGPSLLERMNRLLDMFLPRNMLLAVVEMQMIPLILVALLFGAALTRVEARKREAMVAWLEALNDAMVTIVGFAMKLAPYAVFCLIFGVTARFGLGLLQKLGFYVLLILSCYVVQLFVLYPVLLVLLARRAPWEFLRNAMPVMVTAFSTSSSSATLPTSLRVAREALGIRPQVAGFVLPLGATMNMNGTALFEGAVVLFVAQIFAVELTLVQQFMVVGMCVLTAIGAAGVPGGALPLLMAVMAQVGVPPNGIAIILGVDRLLDMGRTVVNVMGDQICAAYIESFETRVSSA
jgi:DAACS family dicarboxylate/amino acid:cation (Na+ or H+) symporter